MHHNTSRSLQPTASRYPRRLRTELFAMLRRQIEMLIDEATLPARIPARSLAVRRVR